MRKHAFSPKPWAPETAVNHKSQFLKFSFCCLIISTASQQRPESRQAEGGKSFCFQLHLTLASQPDAKCCINLMSHFKVSKFSLPVGTRCLWFELLLGKWNLTANTSDYLPSLLGCPQKKNNLKMSDTNQLKSDTYKIPCNKQKIKCN